MNRAAAFVTALILLISAIINAPFYLWWSLPQAIKDWISPPANAQPLPKPSPSPSVRRKGGFRLKPKPKPTPTPLPDTEEIDCGCECCAEEAQDEMEPEGE